MWIPEQTVMLMAAQRMEEAMRAAERARALRILGTARGSTRVRLGSALIRVGHWVMGQDAVTREPSPVPATNLGQSA